MDKTPRMAWPCAVAGLALLALAIGSTGAGQAAPGGTERVSVGEAGAQGNGESGSGSGVAAAISADGRYVAFASVASNLVAQDTNGSSDVFVRDLQTATTSRVSVAGDGAEGNADSRAPSISADGRYVAFESAASNLVAGDTNGSSDVFVHDRQTGATVRVSIGSAGVEGNGHSSRPAISADGRYAAFASAAGNLVPDDTNAVADIFVHDRQASTTERVSIATGGGESDGASFAAAVSADGRFVAFTSAATDLVEGDTNVEIDVFVHDRQTGGTERASLDGAGHEVVGHQLMTGVAISGAGRYVAFDSFSNSLVPGDTGSQDVFVRDREVGSTTRVSVDSQGQQGSPAYGYNFAPTISADGRYVAFSSFPALVSEDTNNTTDVYVHDRQAGATIRVSVSSAGAQGNGDSRYGAISGNGGYVAFSSEASDLVAGDTNTCASNSPSCRDVFVRELASLFATPAPIPTPSPTPSPTPILPNTGGSPASTGGPSPYALLLLASGAIALCAGGVVIRWRRMR